MSSSKDQWEEKLSPERYAVMREGKTEAPFTGKYALHFENGIYTCGACQTELFKSESKYDAGCGWPSFYQPIDNDVIETRPDNSHNMNRTEIICKKCGSHLGHVFEDGPFPTGQRYCVNSIALDFKE